MRIESRTNLLFSFEKMALRDAVKTPAGARLFATELYAFLWGRGSPQRKFEGWVQAVADLPRRQTRVLTWPLVTVFGFLARPDKHLFLKPIVTRKAARAYGFDFQYRSQPSWPVYQSLLTFAAIIRRDLDRKPGFKARDMMDVQSFIWVQGSEGTSLSRTLRGPGRVQGRFDGRLVGLAPGFEPGPPPWPSPWSCGAAP